MRLEGPIYYLESLTQWNEKGTVRASLTTSTGERTLHEIKPYPRNQPEKNSDGAWDPLCACTAWRFWEAPRAELNLTACLVPVTGWMTIDAISGNITRLSDAPEQDKPKTRRHSEPCAESLQREIGLLRNEIIANRDMNAHRLQQLLDIAADLAKEISAASK